MSKIKKLFLIIFIVAFLISIQFQSEIKNWAHSNPKTKKVVIQTIDSIGGEYSQFLPLILTDGFSFNGINQGDYKFSLPFEKLENLIVENKGFRKFSKEESPYGEAVYVSQSPDAYLIINLPYLPETSLFFLDGDVGSYAVVTVDDEQQIFWFGKGAEGVQTVQVFPFRDLRVYINLYTRYFLAYSVLIVSMFVLISIGAFLLNRYGDALTDNVLDLKAQRWVFCIVFILLFAGTSFYYYKNSESYYRVLNVKSQADVYFYTHPNFYDENGQASLYNFVNNFGMSHRGFYMPLVWGGYNLIAGVVNIDPQYIHLFVLTLLITCTFVFAVPQIAKTLFNIQPTVVSCVVSILLFLFFWKWWIFYYMPDIPSLCFFILSIASLMKGLESKLLSNWFLSGIFISLSINLRSFYIVTLYFIIAFAVWTIWKERNPVKKIENGKLRCCPVSLWGMFFIGVVLATLPQFALGLMKMNGKFALFPYSPAWKTDYTNGFHQSMALRSFQNGSNAYYFMGPRGKDRQIASFSHLFYDRLLSKKDILLMCLSEPLTFFSLMGKKALVAFTPHIEDNYRGGVSSLIVNLSRNISLLLQAGVIFSLKQKLLALKKNSRLVLFAAGILVMNTLPLLLLHIELRYFMFANWVLIFIFTYVTLPVLIRNGKKGSEGKENLIRKFTLSSIVYCYVMGVFLDTIWKNFL